jgi:hypothetical protein
MSFDKIVRRTHVYLGMGLLPWFVMYGVGSVPLAHKVGPATWTVTSEREYRIDAGADLEAAGRAMLEACGLPATGVWGTYKNPQGDLIVYVSRMIRPARVTYDAARGRLKVERREFHAWAILTEMHVRGGFEKGGALDLAWSGMADLSGAGLVIWAISGVYMLWRMRQLWVWGGLALGGGVATFLGLVLRM